MKTYLVTGAAGFIGSHLAKTLLDQGHRVVGIDNFSPYYDQALKQARLNELYNYSEFFFYQVDVQHTYRLARILDSWDPEAVFHLAAQPGVRAGVENPLTALRENTEGFLSVLEAVRDRWGMKVIYASSSSVYGAGNQIPFSEEQHTDTPSHVYGASKKAMELLAHSYHHLYGIDVIGLRYFTVYGEFGRPDMAVWKFTEAILKGGDLELYNGGDQARGFTHVQDVVRATIDAAGLEGCHIINIGGGELVSLRDLISKIADRLDKVPVITHVIQEGDLLRADAPVTLADTKLAKSLLDWEPLIGIDEGLDRFVDWFKEYSNAS